jgi:hypothetical protein
MFNTEENTLTSQYVASNCPCLQNTDPEGFPLQSICFLKYLRGMNREIGVKKQDLNHIDPAAICFCHDSNSITDNSYPAFARESTSITGWGHVTGRSIGPVLNLTFWYKKYSAEYGIPKILATAIRERPFAIVKRAVTQSLHTVTGMMVKRMLCFGPEISNYYRIADQTARVFRDLLQEYLTPVGQVAERPLYAELKERMQMCKASFHAPRPEVRTSWLTKPWKSKSVGAFFGSEFNSLAKLVDGSREECCDYSLSVAWISRCGLFTQTRVVGYLPETIAVEKAKEYRNSVARAPAEPADEDLSLIMMSVWRRLEESDLKPNILVEGIDDARLNKVMASATLHLQGSASVDHTLREGGKLEDARLLIQKARTHNWVTPIRDLHSGRITRHIGAPEGNEDSSSFIFWTGLQLVVNHWVQRGLLEAEYYHPYWEDEGKQLLYSPDVMRAIIVHINESGKMRNLTKSSAALAWALQPGASILQELMAYLPEHEAGMTRSAQDWIHTKRIDGSSEEAHWIYDSVSGKRNPDVFQVFKDWKESTDWIGKRIGIAHLRALMSYVGFPYWYGRVIQITAREPQAVTEDISIWYKTDETEDNPTGYVEERYTHRGVISEGFMMGNPVTKVVLHLVHTSELSVSEEFVKRRGFPKPTGRRGVAPWVPTIVFPAEAENETVHH